MDSPTRAIFAAAQTAFQTAGAAIALLDAEGTVVGWTQAAQRLVGYSAADVRGCPGRQAGEESGSCGAGQG
ncbi:PAS domain S-box protein [Streptomyces sp. NPDC050743]|uniref:PAS domain S-box protein n=1 Tax=Streptomyces sp. NPDC050743 TaxID=3365634 RepID=UPI00379622DD